MSMCTRPGCRKKATYDLTLTRPDRPTPIQQWHLCADHRDAVQFAIADAAWGTRVTVTVPDRVTPGQEGDPLGTLLATQAMLDKEDGDLRDRVAHSETSSEEPKDATPERTLLGGVAKRGRAVASPPALD